MTKVEMDDIDAKLKRFLNRQLIQFVENVERLRGGFINYTFRLYLKDELPFILSDNSNDHNLLALVQQLKPRSLIAKISCPYAAAAATAGKHVPIPLVRQEIEEKALKLFDKFSLRVDDTEGMSVDLTPTLHRNKTIKVSRVWFRDEIDNVLLMDDHSPSLNITKWLISEDRSSSSESIVTLIQTYGEQLGKFIIDMQVSSLPYVDKLKLLLHNSELEQSNHRYVVGLIQDQCNTHNIPDSDELASIFTSYFEHEISRASTDGQVLAHGDLWQGNLLVDERSLTLSIIDWELAGVRSPTHDLALFLAWNQVPMATDPLYEPMISLTNAFINAYRDNAKKEEVIWYGNEREQYRFAWSLGILYGIALIDWSSFAMCCPVQDEICTHRRNSVIQGADFIRRCRSGPEKSTYESISRDQFLGRLF